ncbi:hypothetical protein VQ056_01665 [Paenibacillus sp. JTLBN-2024]
MIASPLYNPEKLMVEYAAGGHDIMILPEEDMKNYGKMGGHVVLDDHFDPKTYPEGVFASMEEKDDKNDRQNGTSLRDPREGLEDVQGFEIYA